MSYAALEVDNTLWLITQLGVSLPDARVLAETPGKMEAHLPVVRVVLAGGSDDGVVLDQPTVVLHCFAADQQAANILAARASTALRALRGRPAGGAVLTFVHKTGGATPAHYENTTVRETVIIHRVGIKTTA